MTTQTEFGPQIRLLLCFDCKTIDELPDFDGPPEYDDLLELCIERNHTDPITKLGHFGRLGKVEVKVWEVTENRRKIIEQMHEGSDGIDEFDAEFYDTRSTFFDDAMTCFGKHNRPKGRCPDWKHDSKKLVPNTAAARKEAGLGKISGPTTYLCQFCPVSTYMITKAREEAGQYK